MSSSRNYAIVANGSGHLRDLLNAALETKDRDELVAKLALIKLSKRAFGQFLDRLDVDEILCSKSSDRMIDGDFLRSCLTVREELSDLHKAINGRRGHELTNTEFFVLEGAAERLSQQANGLQMLANLRRRELGRKK